MQVHIEYNYTLHITLLNVHIKLYINEKIG